MASERTMGAHATHEVTQRERLTSASSFQTAAWALEQRMGATAAVVMAVMAVEAEAVVLVAVAAAAMAVVAAYAVRLRV